VHSSQTKQSLIDATFHRYSLIHLTGGATNRLSRGVMNEYSFEVKLRAFVRVRASDKNEASRVVESVLGAPSSMEIDLANENSAALGCAAAVTAVTFQQTGDPRVVRDNGPKTAEGHIVETSGPQPRLAWG
jgi:hypothetical protein